MARRFVTDDCKINDNIIEIYGEEAKHIEVLRHKINDIIEVNNRNCKIINIEKNKVVCEMFGEEIRRGIPKVDITLYQALLKSDKMEYVIQKSVELGISKIVPFESKNIVVKLKDNEKNKKIDRYNKISKEATKQCGRTDEVEVTNVMCFKEMLNSLDEYTSIILAYENEEQPLKEMLKKINHEKIAIIIGAEGGFDKEEVEKILENKKAVSVSLGDRILRAETASLNLISILGYEFDV
ncbi:MAG: 16S rRNA (uracil(1498)-N(3))-methyltransferase [Clostridiales bacterium]|nr:16S rRNA (uracil(1498)-N(3))-methyltransferase [Clostridiales bacterium]